GGDDRIAADDAVGDLSRRLRARERVFGSERRVDERPQLGGRVASDVELFNHGDVGGEPAKNVDAGLLVRLIVTGRQVAGDEAQMIEGARRKIEVVRGVEDDVQIGRAARRHVARRLDGIGARASDHGRRASKQERHLRRKHSPPDSVKEAARSITSGKRRPREALSAPLTFLTRRSGWARSEARSNAGGAGAARPGRGARPRSGWRWRWQRRAGARRG